MSKSIIGLAFNFAALALMFIPGVGTALGLGMKAIALGMNAAQLIGTGLMLASSVLLGPKKPTMPRTQPSDRLYAQLDPSSPRKIAFGVTALAADVRYHAFTGNDQQEFQQIICLASHEVESIDQIWMDNELAWSAGTVQGRYATSPTGPFLWVTTRDVGTNANGIAINGTWTSACTLTGCAYIHLKYRLVDGGGQQNDSPFATGIPTRMTIRGKGALLYDPRLDGTVAGGSGSQRADTQSTWAYSSSTVSNPALQLLWYLLGWKINGKLAVGMGMPPARIDLPSFITAANACEELVTKNGGGTEKRYQSDGVFSEADDRRAVIDALCLSMNAILRDSGGKISLTVISNDLASPVASFDEGDIIGNEQWSQTPDIKDSTNIVRGRRIDPSDAALYQPVDYPEISFTSTDGIDRIDSIDFLTVQSNGQAQRLAKQRLQRNQYQGVYSADFGPRAWQVKIGDPVQFSHQGLGWSNKLFRVTEQGISRTGSTRLVLLEEHSSIYAWDNSEAAGITPGTPVVYDPTNSPILVGIRDAKASVGNELTDTLFRNWVLTSGAERAVANALLGYALGNESYHLVLSPSAVSERSATSPLVPVTAGLRYYFTARAQRGTTLGSGSRLNLGGEWIAADGVTVTAIASEGVQQTPSTLTAGALPKEVLWSEVAPAGAAYFRFKFYTPALASSSGTFRVEAPRVMRAEAGADITSYIDGPASANVLYDSTGTTIQATVDLAYMLKNFLGTITSGVTATYEVVDGNVNGFSSASGPQTITVTSGVALLSITAMTTATAEIKVTMTQGGIIRTKAGIQLTRVLAAAGSSSGGGPSQTSGFTAIPNASLSTFTDISSSLSITTTASKVLRTTVVLAPRLSSVAATPQGPWNIECRLMRTIGGTPTQEGSTQNSNPDPYINTAGDVPVSAAGTLSFVIDTSSLAAGTYVFKLQARISSGSLPGTGNMNFTAPSGGGFRVEAV